MPEYKDSPVVENSWILGRTLKPLSSLVISFYNIQIASVGSDTTAKIIEVPTSGYRSRSLLGCQSSTSPFWLRVAKFLTDDRKQLALRELAEPQPRTGGRQLKPHKYHSTPTWQWQVARKLPSARRPHYNSCDLSRKLCSLSNNGKYFLS